MRRTLIVVLDDEDQRHRGFRRTARLDRRFPMGSVLAEKARPVELQRHAAVGLGVPLESVCAKRNRRFWHFVL